MLSNSVILRCLLFLTAVVALLPAQERRALRYHDCRAWRGSIVARAVPDAASLAQLQAGMAGKVRLDVDYVAYWEIAFELKEMETSPWVWRGKITRSRYESGYRSHLTAEGVDQEEVFTANGPMTFDADHEVRLEFHHDDTWSVRGPSTWIDTRVHKRTTMRDGKVFRQHHDGHGYGMGSTGHHAFAPAGAVLYASATKPGSFPGAAACGITPAVQWEYAVYLEPLAWDELRLDIEPPRDYATWLPTTTPDCRPGRPLVVAAELVTVDGGTPRVAVESFEWELLKTSREPGVALNWPLDAKDQRYDLDLDAEGGFFQREDENQRLVRAVQSGHRDSVKVLPYDWGAWSWLRVTAVTADGRRILGRVRGDPDSGLRIPMRAADSKIADVWRQRTGCSADALDDDAEPVGDGNVGDGYSNYEEYRGFVMAGGHIRTAPKQKELFVRNRVGAKLLPGVFLFTDATGIRTRYELRESEMGPDRIMNGNRSQQSPRSTACYQTGLRLELVEGGDASIAMTNRETLVGRPKDYFEILINVDLLEPGREAELRATVAHELSHCCGVPHHGEVDHYVAWLRKQRVVDGRTEWWFEERPARLRGGQFEFPSTPGPHIRIFAPNGAELVPERADFFDKAKCLFLGFHGGQHSGDVGCYMRYVAAEAFVVPQHPDHRYLSPDEPSGIGICTSPIGTRFNAPDLPLPRYGNATCGACAQQLCVRDDAPLRKQ